MNWKLRLKNKATLVALAAAVVAFVYQVLGIFGVIPAVSQDTLTQMLGILINLLVALGVVVDPTTQGISDSAQAQSYDAPKTNSIAAYQAVAAANYQKDGRKDDEDEGDVSADELQD